MTHGDGVRRGSNKQDQMNNSVGIFLKLILPIVIYKQMNRKIKPNQTVQIQINTTTCLET